MALLTAKRPKKEAAPATDSSNNESDSEDSQNVDGDTGANAGWADCIGKVLKSKSVGPTVLSRAKKNPAVVRSKTSEAAKKPGFDFEVVGGDVKEEDDDDEEDGDADKSALDATLTKTERRNVPLQLRVKPSYQDLERERTLRKVATRGVVQFFNAVRIQQKDLEQQLADAGPLDSRQDAVLNNINKRKFLDVLMSGKRAKSTAIDNAVKKEEQETDDDDEDDTAEASSTGKKKSEWNVLREDFMTNKKIKHWDEEDDEGSDQGANNDEADDSDDDDEED
ncbi:RRP15-like protein [Drosophila pseudoobscura]|uniref:RRP15-like protein n=1 Tax=Drosophila pseudoobscura TaxID=7237 RepID=UPI00143F1BCD|nr:RRP15-like protein [Drosophila pseudoobscura]